MNDFLHAFLDVYKAFFGVERDRSPRPWCERRGEIPLAASTLGGTRASRRAGAGQGGTDRDAAARHRAELKLCFQYLHRNLCPPSVQTHLTESDQGNFVGNSLA